MTRTAVKFTSTSGDPTEVRLTATDGKTYRARIVVNVVEAFQAEGEFDPSGVPKFELGLGLLVNTSPESP